MDLLRRLFGADDEPARPARATPRHRDLSADEQAIERYRYLLRTAPPGTVEEAHAEAFSKLTPEQRRLVLQELSHTLSPAEHAAGVTYDDDPRSLARLATRAEMRQPGALERTWSTMPPMPSITGTSAGGFLMGNFLSTIAGVMLGSVIADAFLGDAGYDQGFADGLAADGHAAEGGDLADASVDDGGFSDFGDFDGFGDF